MIKAITNFLVRKLVCLNILFVVRWLALYSFSNSKQSFFFPSALANRYCVALREFVWGKYQRGIKSATKHLYVHPQRKGSKLNGFPFHSLFSEHLLRNCPVACLKLSDHRKIILYRSIGGILGKIIIIIIKNWIIIIIHSLMELSPSWEAANCAATQ
jgi:hypothetical protein